VVTVTPNFALLETSHPEVASLVAAMLQARDAVERRSWAHPQEPTGEDWWADVLADPRARKRERRTDLAVKQAFYRLADEKRETILVACSKCDWRAAFSRDHLIASHGADYAMPNLLNHLAAPSCSRLGSHWDWCGVQHRRSHASSKREPACAWQLPAQRAGGGCFFMKCREPDLAAVR
jgi:hypothetical protein